MPFPRTLAAQHRCALDSKKKWPAHAQVTPGGALHHVWSYVDCTAAAAAAATAAAMLLALPGGSASYVNRSTALHIHQHHVHVGSHTARRQHQQREQLEPPVTRSASSW